MASNSTLLAIQCATGVPVPRCHLHRNLVTKTHNPTFKAANPAVQYEAGALVSTPSQLHRNLVSKRDKTIMAAYPINIQYTTDVPEYTEVILENFSGEVLKLDACIIWTGSRAQIFPEEIPNYRRREFTHQAISRGEVRGSVVGLEYLFGEKFKWIIAWSNLRNEINKVYTQILEGEVVDWDEIEDNLQQSGQMLDAAKYPYLSHIEIDPTSSRPTVYATLKLILDDDDKPASKA